MTGYIETNITGFRMRYATREDVPLILEFIKGLAVYENMLADVVATEEILTESIFDKNGAEVLIGEYEGKPVSFILYFFNYSTFVGRSGLYLEDLFVIPEMRKRGFGREMFTILARIAKERNCGRFEWACLDWNKPSIEFYTKMGAVPMSDWTVYRISGKALDDLAGI